MAADTKITVLDKRGAGSWRVAFWLTTPVARKSYWASIAKPSVIVGISAPDAALLADGTLVEEVDILSFQGSPTPSEMKDAAELQWQQFQNKVAAYNPWVNYGSTWDGTTWVMTGAS